jgi:hypothetical protein
MRKEKGVVVGTRQIANERGFDVTRSLLVGRELVAEAHLAEPRCYTRNGLQLARSGEALRFRAFRLLPVSFTSWD